MQPKSHSDRPFDIIVMGASGFTGRLVVEYLANQYSAAAALRWAIAGRNEEKLRTIAASVGSDGKEPQVLLADSGDARSLRQMARQARVILTTVGPYARYGNELVAACAELGTHYCDLAGEPQWIRQMIDRHQVTAERSGAIIVPSCGFDSIPSDLGVFFLQREALRRHGEPCRDVHLLVKALKGGVSGGTVASMFNALDDARRDRDLARIMADPYGLNPPGDRAGPDGADQRGIGFSPQAASWTAPFVMAAINTRIVRRSNALLDYCYGREFRYSEATSTGPGLGGWLRAVTMTGGLALFVLGSSFGFTREKVIKRLIPAPGSGPARQQRESGYFDLRLYGTTASGESLRARVTGDCDPGYGSTSKMLAESAICLADESIELPGGFWTPASAMATPLLDRLEANAGLTFELMPC